MRKSWLIYILLIIIVLLLILFYFKGCCHCEQDVQQRNIPVDMSQVIFWKNPDSSEASFIKYLDDHFPNKQVDKRNYCQNCDSDLVMVSGADVVVYLLGQTTSGGSGGKGGLNGKPPGQGGDGPVLISLNFPIDIKDSVELDSLDCVTLPPDTTPVINIKVHRNYYNPTNNCNSPITPAGAYAKTDTVTVAVFDSGLDSATFADYLYKNSNPSCLDSLANNGWNFPAMIPNWNDDNTPQHGTIVSRFIIDQANKYKNNFVKILPVKISSSNGTSHLFDVLCALSYAKNRGADIINASFGFYATIEDPKAAHPDSSVYLFHKFLEKYLNSPEHVMLMVAAAGNKNDTLENYVYTSTNPVARRNLDSVGLYPASFARYIPNVIAVTTVSERLKKVSPHQNFSAHVVDFGVNADTTIGDTDFLFVNPVINIPGKTLTVEGSSFATPIATGKIAANYYLIKNLIGAGKFDEVSKQKMIKFLSMQNILHTGGPAFTEKIKNRGIMTK